MQSEELARNGYNYSAIEEDMNHQHLSRRDLPPRVLVKVRLTTDSVLSHFTDASVLIGNNIRSDFVRGDGPSALAAASAPAHRDEGAPSWRSDSHEEDLADERAALRAAHRRHGASRHHSLHFLHSCHCDQGAVKATDSEIFKS